MAPDHLSRPDPAFWSGRRVLVAQETLGWSGRWDWQTAIGRRLDWYVALGGGASAGAVIERQVAAYTGEEPSG